MLTAQHILLQDAQIIDVIQNQIIPNQTLEIMDGQIVNIYDGRYENEAADTIIALHNKYIIPGLIDCHTHIEHSGSWQTTTKYNPPRSSLVALLEHAVLGGVTTIREMACDVRVMAELSRAAKLELIPSPDIYYPSLFAGPSFFQDPRADAGALGEIPGHTSWFRGIDDHTDLSTVIAQAKGNGSMALKLYALLDPDQIKAICQEAHLQNMKVWAHASTQYAKPSEVVASGVQSISHATMLLYEMDPKSDQITYPEDDSMLHALFDLMKTNEVSLDPTLFIYQKSDRFKTAAKITSEAFQAGVRIIAGTDSISAYRDNPLPFIHDEMKFYVQDCEIPPLDALKTATINAAITLGLENEIGSIETGKRANLIVLDKNPIDDIQHTKSIHFVMKNGIIYQR